MFECVGENGKYLIQPFIGGRPVKVAISQSGGVVSVRVSGEGGKKEKIGGRIRKDLAMCYGASRFRGHPVVLSGFLTLDRRGVMRLVLNDILLKDEYDGKAQSRRYSVRLENLNARFLSPKAKSLRSVFSSEASGAGVDMFVKAFVQTQLTDKVVFRRDSPKGVCENEVVIEDIWTRVEGEIVGFAEGEAVKGKPGEGQEAAEGEPFRYLKSFSVKVGGEEVTVELSGMLDSDKAEMLAHADGFIGRKCELRRYSVLGREGYVFVKCA